MTEKAGANGKKRGGTRENMLSMGNINEMLKRKREEEGNRRMMEIFKKSKKTPRSPAKGEMAEGERKEVLMRRWREELGEVLEEIKRMKG